MVVLEVVVVSVEFVRFPAIFLSCTTGLAYQSTI